MVKKNSIPDRWRSLQAVGQRVPGSRFIAFKVPLKGATNQRVTQNQKFTPKDLLTTIRNQNEELGLIIDLTNTERYYTTKDLPKSVQYVKLHTAGLKIPDDATIHQFKRVVRRFLFAHEDDDKIIGVHCTTGINRTGYLICRYLIDIEGWRPLHAISAFANARSHPIEGAVYIEDLIKGAPRSNVGIDTPQTDEERRALESTEDILWDRPRSILEAANEFGDFDARGRRDRPMEREDFNEDLSGGRGPLPNILGDHDLRLTSQPQGRGYMNDGPGPMHPAERFRRPGPHMEGRFNPEALNRRGFYGPGPRPLMGIQGHYGPRMMQRPFEGPGMGHEDMDYDLRRGGRPNPGQFDNSFPHPGPSYNPMYNEEEEDEEYSYEEDYYDESADYDCGAQGAMDDSFQGPPNERMNPNARPMQGSMNNRMRPRDPRFMNEKRFSGNVQGSQGPMNERIPQRNARPMGPPVGERANARQGAFMEGPRNTQWSEDFTSDQINPRDTRGMKSFMNETDFSANEGPTNKRMHPNAGRQMDLPMNERVNQGGGRPQDGHMSQRDVQGADKSMYGMQGSRAMDDSMNNQMYPGDSQTFNDPRMYSRNAKSFDGTVNDRGYARDSQAMDNSMNNRMPQRNQHAMDSGASNQMYPRDPRGMDGSMNENMQTPRAQDGSANNWMHERGTMEGPINERMHPHDNKFAMNKPRPVDGPMRQNFPNDAGSFEGRNVNATEGPSRFAPYPPRKPMQTQDSMGTPRNDQYNMGHPTHWN